MKTQRALAMLNMLIFVVLFTIFSGIILSLLSSHTTMMEHYIRRTKAFYAAEAGSVADFESIRMYGAPTWPLPIDWVYDVAGNLRAGKDIIVYDQPGSDPFAFFDEIISNCDYTLNW